MIDFDFYKFGQALKEFMEGCKPPMSQREAARGMGIDNCVVKRCIDGTRISGLHLAIISYWIDKDIREFIVDDESRGSQISLKLKQPATRVADKS